MAIQEDYIFSQSKLSADEIETFMLSIDGELFEKLSARLNIRDYCKKIEEYALHFAIHKGEELIGLSPCYFNVENQGKAYISALLVKQIHQGIGLKKTLLNRVKEYATQNDFHELIVSFHCDNIKSIEFYQENTFFKYNHNNDLCVFKFQHKS